MWQEQYYYENLFSDKIMKLRNTGRLDDAIKKCQEAISQFPRNNFFYKILGDIYLQNGNLEDAADEYLESLKLIKDQPDLFHNFVRFYRSFQAKASEKLVFAYIQKIKTAIEQNDLSQEISENMVSFLGNNVIADQNLITFLPLADDDKNYKFVYQKMKEWEQNHKLSNIQAVVTHKLEASDYHRSKRINQFLIQLLEKNAKYNDALSLIDKTQKPCTNRLMICCLLRICRRISDYSFAEKILRINDDFIEKADFNIQYELVYYFQATKDDSSLNKILKQMRSSAERSIPIARTLYNFYLNFNKFSEAQSLYEHLQQLETRIRQRKYNSRREEQLESDQVIWQKLKDLVSEQEHNRQMIALRDLLKGFSHELGQPITNIRYAVQLQQLKIQRNISTSDDVSRLLTNILDQTTRIGTLLARFRPIVSSKSTNSLFSIPKCIQSVFTDLGDRLKEQNISYRISGSSEICAFGDEVQFSQVLYNLVLNSMQAIENNGNINVDVNDNRHGKTEVLFSDNGPGIPPDNIRKVFQPFFSTKDPTSGNGGEGLGLFIVWNILKMFDGTIQIDETYHHGAKFVIRIPTKKEAINK